jgi:hypothetical protein
VSKPGPQVAVDIHKAGHHQPVGLDDVLGAAGEVRAYGSDAPVLDEDVGYRVQAIRGVEHAAAANE